jgi:tetratricopeptide (TPR) repeat protein
MDRLRPNDSSPLEPSLSPTEREERTCLDYFLEQISRLRERGLIPESSFETIRGESGSRREAIERRGLVRAALDHARRLSQDDPRGALSWADRARGIDSSEPEPWVVAIDLCRRLRENDRALELCNDAAGRFSDFPVSPEALRRELEAGLLEDSVVAARSALERGDDAEVEALCNRRLSVQPDHFDSTVLLAFALQRQNRLDEALLLYRRVAEIQPENAVWSMWVKDIEGRQRSRAKGAMTVAPTATTQLPAATAYQNGPGPVGVREVELISTGSPARSPVSTPSEPPLTWSSVTSEFLLDHWQIILSCMAVLLIVVSSNVGAYQLLGPKLWSPAGKTVLALIYTSMFAGFGTGLVRWGASRAGKVMLLTTLIVVPANFMLAGEMKLVSQPTAAGLALLAVDAAALLLLIRAVSGSLGVKRGAWPLSASLFALGAFNAVAAPGMSWPFSWQVALFLAPSAVFLAAVTWLNTRFEADESSDRAAVSYAALGLFAFAFFTGVARTGVFVLHLAPALYALPVMVAALATVQTSRTLGRFDPHTERANWARFGGIVLSGLAFALALARPPGVSPVYSGNTLAVALLGLGLYAYLLWNERQPSYLYFSFGALIVSYFGAFYFVSDMVHAVEEVARQALGYQSPLPQPFKAINGLVFSTVLGLLSRFFRDRWHDERLARHCQLIGLPFSIACCLISALEPKAAVICMSGYAVLYALAVWVFAEPRVIYLSAAALAGAAYFGLSLVPGATLAHLALASALIALGEWVIERSLKHRGADRSYLRPLVHASLAMSALAMAAAAGSAVPPGGVTATAAAAFAVVAFVAVMLNREGPGKALAYLAAVSGSLGYAFFVLSAGERWGAGLDAAQDAVAAGAAGFGLAALSVWLGRIRGPSGETPPRLAVYPGPMAHVAFVGVALAVGLCLFHVVDRENVLPGVDHMTLAGAFALAGSALAVLSERYPRPAVAHLALACGLGVWLALARAALGLRVAALADYGALGTGYALALLVWGEAVRSVLRGRKAVHDSEFATAAAPNPRLALFASVLPEFVAGLTITASALAVFGLDDSLNAAATFALGSAVVLWTTRERPRARLVDLGLALAVLSALCLTSWRVGFLGHWDVTAGWLALTAACSALVLRAVGRWAERSERGELYAEGCHRAVGATSWLVFALAIAGRVFSRDAYPLCASALGLNAVALLLLTTARPRAQLTYRAIVSVVLAVYVVVFSVGKGSPDTAHVPGLIAVVLGLLLQAVGFAGRSRPREGWERLYLVPLFRSALFLTILGIATAYWSPAAMLLAGLSFLALVKGWPGRSWLYATVLACCTALYFGVLRDWPPTDRLVTAAMVVAYQLWLVGLLVRRAEPALIQWLKLPQTGYANPLFHSALVSAAFAAVLRWSETLDGTFAWTDSAGLTLNLAVFLLLIVKAYPNVFWVYASVGLASLSAWMATYALFPSSTWFLPLAMGLALLWQATARAWRRFEVPLGRLARVEMEGYPDAVGRWSLAFFWLASVVVAVVVSYSVGLAVLTTPAADASQVGHWSPVMLAIGLGALFVFAFWGRSRPAGALMGGFVAAVLAVWWLFVPASPLPARLGLGSEQCLPFATSLLALGAVVGGVKVVNRQGWWAASIPGDEGPDPWGLLPSFLVRAGFLLALLGPAMTLGASRPDTTATLLTATVALGFLAFERRWVSAAYAAGLVGCAAGLSGSMDVSRLLKIVSGPDRAVGATLGLLAAVLALWGAAGWLRRREEERDEGHDPTDVPARTVAVALEQVALVASVFCASGVVSTLFLPGRPADRAAMLGVGVLFALALIAVGLLRRWRVSWLVYAAQGALLGSYLYYRWAFPLPATTDAVVLTLFGYLDFGLAEAMHRIGLGNYARPTRRFAMAVPLIPLALSFWGGGGPLSETSLFVLFTAATFYGVACYRLQSRPVGYAAAVLYNGFLWVLWSRIGWTLADRPQFFLAPVGLTAILFAEVNRGTFPRQALNAIRGIGLSTIYLSLAVPVWQFQSLGAWALLLLVSFAGVLAGIGLRVQTFLWLGLTGFVLDVVYQLGRVGMENTLAKWGIMLALGILIMLFVAFNEKKRIVESMRAFYDEARQWE